jgi:uncharacterized repeat protein (TIGR03809 family)
MAHRSDVARGREIIERWCLLAEQRLDYLTDLFESGRWRRFYSEIAFLENIQEAKTAVETWRRLLTQEGSSDNSAIDTSWLDRRRTVPPRQASILRHEVRPTLPRSLQIVGERVAPEPLVDLTSEATPSDQTASASSADDNAWERELDLSTMQQRYPLLRNTL